MNEKEVGEKIHELIERIVFLGGGHAQHAIRRAVEDLEQRGISVLIVDLSEQDSNLGLVRHIDPSLVFNDICGRKPDIIVVDDFSALEERFMRGSGKSVSQALYMKSLIELPQLPADKVKGPKGPRGKWGKLQ